MKNVSWVLFNMIVISAALNLSKSSLDKQMSNRQPKFYGPLLGALLANLLALPISARLSPQGSLRLSYDPHPNSWKNQPHQPSNYESNESFRPNPWQPVSSYGAPQYYPTMTTVRPQIHHHHHHGTKPGTSQQQIVTIHEHPNDVIIEDSYPDVSDIPQSTIVPTALSNLETPTGLLENPIELQEPIPVESRVSARRQKVPKEFKESRGKRVTTYKPKQKRGTQRYYSGKKKYSSNKRRKYTTTENYYDSYEEYTTEKPRRKTQAKRPVNSYEDSASEYDDYEYEESYEFTTRRPYKKRRRTTTRRNRYKNKNKKRQEEYDEDDYDFNYRDPFDTINIRPRQESTTESSTTTTESSTSTTTTQSTTITNGTTVSPNSTTNSTGYGYGPSNGNEGISITYGPPTGQNGAYGPPRPSYGPPHYPQYHAQYSDWYESEATRNAIVQKVHDLIGIDHIFQRRLT